MRHIDRAHLSMMRHLSAQARRKGANSVAEQIGRTGHAPVQRDTALARAQHSFRREQQAAARSMAQPHHTHVKSSIQRGLEAIGLGGAAHPIRRLHHPGGQAAFPLSGYAEATGGQTLLKAFVHGSSVAAAGTLAAEWTPRYGMVARKLRRQEAWDRQHPAEVKQRNAHDALADPAAQAYSQGGQDAKNARLMHGFETDVRRLQAEGRLAKTQADHALGWAHRQAASANGTLEVRNARQYLHEHFKAPSAGWAPHVGG